ncbi:hypothetical protein LCGC14_0366860, partial [marine sediment metagenome]
NDGSGDQHNLPFSGTVDWPRLVRTIAESSYVKPLSLEVTMGNFVFEDEDGEEIQGVIEYIEDDIATVVDDEEGEWEIATDELSKA